MTEGFVQFRGKASRVCFPSVTISPSRDNQAGNLYFNAQSYEFMGKPAYLSLYYDAEKRRVGFKPIALDDEDHSWAYKVVKNRTRNHFIVCASKFINRYDLPRCYKLPLYEDSELFVADLPEGVPDEAA